MIKMTHYQYLDMLRRLSRINPEPPFQYTLMIAEDTFYPSRDFSFDRKAITNTIKAVPVTFFYHRDITGQTTWMPRESIHIVGWDEQNK